MDGSKHAMYTQAGKVRGWTQGSASDYAAAKSIMKPVVPAVPVPDLPAAHMAEPVTAPVHEYAMPKIPEPSVLVLPELEQSGADCQTVAMAHFTNEKWSHLYEPNQGFERGTLFQDLDLPFVGEGACKYE